MTSTPSKSVAIIGAGPAGLMAAERLAAAGCAVTIYERMPSPGRKLLMAGRGGLNLTHSEPVERFLTRYCDPEARIAAAVQAFPPAATIAWAESLGQETFVGSSGRVFPRALKASPLLRAWLARLLELGVSIKLRHRWTGWTTDGVATFTTADGTIVRTQADAYILALGGASWPRLGSDGAWEPILQTSGQTVTPLKPSNAGVTIAWSPHIVPRFEGAPLKRIAAACGAARARGEAVISRAGLEGGAVYAINGAIREALAASQRATIFLDLRPDISEDALAERLSSPRGKATVTSFLRKRAGLSPAQIAVAREGCGPDGMPSDPLGLARAVKHAALTVTGLAGIERAISTAGGLALHGLDHHFMLTAQPGWFAAGEMLDWDAPTGGYLLQATLATAVAAADGVIAWLARTQ